MSPQLRLAVGSIVVGFVVLGLKLLAWQMTGSVALLSDALESLVNVATAIAALIAIRVAAKPADADHPYGHHKAELLSAILEGVMIILAAILILREAWFAFQAPRALDAPLSGLLVNGAAGVLNALWCWVLIRQGRRLRSPALVADGKHLLSDVISSAGVLFGVLLAIETGWAVLDPAMAALVALNILWSGWKVMSHSVSGLLDEAVPEEVMVKVREAISREGEGAVEAHDLRTRHAGRATFIEFHFVVPGSLTVSEAHEMCDRVEAALKKVVPDCVVTIHVEPEHKAKHSGIVVI
ncbi:cation diffusion facilitator family transporter [Fuscibacter oryzae]|uniref:Protein p34 n=1 Tax=Fuscibacter oryzae TaxID=2803939 RepID=A0A8J7MP06_9RHOB|nr:cation diffusion facilitator family transporter [Fuscibacter oryzae]MBL4927762.1 cation transporter [Fuscibacter oryzae]